MKLLHRLWIKSNDVDEYDVKYGSWKIYQKMYKNNLNFTDNDIIRNDGRPYVKCQFKYKNKFTKQMKFSGETDFNFSKKRNGNYVEADMNIIKKYWNVI